MLDECCGILKHHENDESTLFKPQKKYYTNRLTRSEQDTLFDISTHCYIKAVAHESESRKYRCLSKWILLSLTINTFLIGGNDLLNLTYTFGEYDNRDISFYEIFAFLSLLNMVLVSCNSVINPLTKSNAHRQSYLTYLSIMRDANHVHKMGVNVLHIGDIINTFNSNITECEVTSLPI